MGEDGPARQVFHAGIYGRRKNQIEEASCDQMAQACKKRRRVEGCVAAMPFKQVSSRTAIFILKSPLVGDDLMKNISYKYLVLNVV